MKLPRIGSVFGSDKKVREALVEKATREADTGRRLVMFDRESGLYAYWYLARRFESETARATRYGRPLSIVLLEVRRDAAHRNQDEVQHWLLGELRTTDLLTHLGDGRYLALLTETDEVSAAATVSRLEERFSDKIAVGFACYPEAGSTLEQLEIATQGGAQRSSNLAG